MVLDKSSIVSFDVHVTLVPAECAPDLGTHLGEIGMTPHPGRGHKYINPALAASS